ncbi:MAG TPA: hypothetical protein VFA12_07700 [Stellaceae bacterium]|nr:hypothetical protein [Stellaceae bacterium]
MRNTLVFAVLFSLVSATTGQANPQPLFHQYRAYVTGYNTVPEQTDGTPCIAASGDNICGRTDTVACPRRIPLGTYLQIRGATYVCEDRLARKYDSRFDISCDKDMNCPGQVTGWAVIRVFGPERREPVIAAAAQAFVRAMHRRLVWHGRGHPRRTLL